jgi:adenylosuccinate synthase
MPVVVVVGAQWGDEGKGKVVDLLAEKAHVVARWAGGANAGHTLVVEGKKYVTHLIPSGVLRRRVSCVLGEGMVIDPRMLVEELRAFREHGLLTGDGELVIARRAHLTLPHHRELDRLREERPGAIGTTKRGIGPSYESKAARSGVRVEDLLRPERFRRNLASAIAAATPLLREMGGSLPDADAIAADYLTLADEFRAYIGDASRFLYQQIRAGKNVMFEGAQGVLLDLDHGTYPFVSSSTTTAGGACVGCGIGPRSIDRVIGLVKAYATRVGLGPFPTELHDEVGARLRERGAEYGATTGRPRRCGWLDLPALRLAARLSGIDALALTKLDVLEGMNAVKLCVGYRLRGEVLDEIPLDLDDLADAEPVYESLPGWPVRPGATQYTDEAHLPDAARRYLTRIRELVGLPIDLISLGPGRDETIVKRDPFAAVRAS